VIRKDAALLDAPTPPGDRLVSVVIPTKNSAAQLERILAAVFDQAPAARVKLEVIVADDGSTDDTALIACRAGARVLIRSGQRAGIAGSPEEARSRAAAAASGDPVVFLEPGCTPGPGWLKAELEAHDGRAAAGAASAPAPGPRDP